ncbi:MAG: phosphate acyltransferase [Planctomycetota bacterium]
MVGDVLDRFFTAARQRQQRVVLPEGENARVIAAAECLLAQGVAIPILLGAPDRIRRAAAGARLDVSGIELMEPRAAGCFDAYVHAYRRHRHVKEGVARRMMARPLFFGGMMVAQGDAATMVGGVDHATATVIQAGALTVGLASGVETVSSFFLMVLPEFQGRTNYSVLFADCAVTVAPTPAQLADIALASHASAERLLGDTPRVALLSFSTLGSAAHTEVDKVKEAVSLARRRAPEALVDGEFQVDSAIVPRVAARKVKRPSNVAGQANVLVFPDLNSGNTAYKLTQYMAGAQAIGPFLQGFAKPISDLSRGASADDIVATVAVLLAMA